MKRNRIAAAVLAALTILSVPAAAGEITADPGIDSAEDVFVIAGTTPLTGQFYTDLWGNASGDLDIRAAIHGYHLVFWDRENAMFTVDPSVVEGYVVTENSAGDRTYRVTLQAGHTYSDGTPITAADYVFTVLLENDPKTAALGARQGKGSYILGCDAYQSGQSNVFSGLRLLGEQEFSITVDHSYLPFFYEFGLLDVFPSPVHVLAPGCGVKDDGAGAYIEGWDAVSAEDLTDILLDPETGYCAHPSVVSGPYQLEAFDGSTAALTANPAYQGDAEGMLPQISDIRVTSLHGDELLEALTSGEVSLLNKITDKEALGALLPLTGADGEYSSSTYPRSGLSFLAFTQASVPAKAQNVRAALARAIDEQALAQAYVGNYGTAVSGWYGIGQWPYVRATQSKELDAIPSYSSGDREADLKEAVALLEEDGWTLNETGDPYQSGTDAVRCKEEDGALIPLTLSVLVPEGNRMAALLEEIAAADLATIGVSLTVTQAPMQTVLASYYGQEHAEADLIYLATNFDIVFDPRAEFVKTSSGEWMWNHSGIVDEALYQAAEAVSRTLPGDVEAYQTAWLAFQERFAEVLPAIPVYSNVYFDLYEKELSGYDPASDMTWSQSILGAYLAKDEGINTAEGA